MGPGLIRPDVAIESIATATDRACDATQQLYETRVRVKGR